MSKYVLIILFVFVFVFIWSYYIEPNLLVVKHYTASEFGDKKIVFVSDFHIAKGEKKRLQRIVNTINQLEPDLVISGGDYIKGHDGGNTLPIEEQVVELKKIEAPVVSVLGNHDGWFDKEFVRETLQGAGIQVLENSSAKIEGIYVAGVEDMQTGFPDVELALAKTESPRILVSHTPDIYYDVREKVDLILAGHVHGGQVRIPFYGAVIVPSKYGTKFAYGVIEENQNRMIITGGLGTSILPFRFCALPEIVVIN